MSSCTLNRYVQQTTANISDVKFLGAYEISYNLFYKNSIIGGLSGIDYDKKNDQYYLVSDDRSDKNPARFYTAKIYIGQQGVDSVIFTGVENMLQQNGKKYPKNREDRSKTPDPEAIRLYTVKQQLLWSSEGERIVTESDTLLQDPSVNIISPQGKFIYTITLPENLKMQSINKGPRKNGVLEGMTFADNYKTLFINVEEPLYEDGPRADLEDNNSYIRIYRFKSNGWKSTGQFAYKLEPVAYPAVPEQAFKINGVPDMLSIGKNKLLVIERSFSTGRLPCTIKLFVADLTGSTDISNTTLKGNNQFTPASKKLLLNMDKLGIYTDNIEGVTFGPLLPNGHKTLLFIADNNFSQSEKTQLLLFEVIE